MKLAERRGLTSCQRSFSIQSERVQAARESAYDGQDKKGKHKEKKARWAKNFEFPQT